jgi:hypothetical protein
MNKYFKFILLFLILNLTIQSCSTNRSIVLRPLDVNATQPSIISVLFQATDTDGKPVPDLKLKDFLIYEDEKPLSISESFKEILSQNSFPYKLKIVIAIDVSKSILAKDKAEMVKALKSLIEQDNGFILNEHHEMMILTFSESIFLKQGYTSDKELILKGIERINDPVYEASTNLYGALAKGVSFWEDKEGPHNVEKGYLILITDGVDDTGSLTLDDAIKIRGDKSVYTIGVGNKINTTIMEQLGNMGYFSLSKFSELERALEEVIFKIEDYSNSFYVFRYASPKRKSIRGDSIHSLKLEVLNNPNTEPNSFISADFDSSMFQSIQPEITIKPVGNLRNEDTMILEATTEWVMNHGTYEWQVADPNLVSLTVNHSNSAEVTIKSNKGQKGMTTIKVKDLRNRVEQTYPIAVGIFTDIILDFEDGNISSELEQIGGTWKIDDEYSVGRYAIKSPPTKDGNYTSIMLRGTFEAKKISFDYRIESEEGCDSLIFFMDGQGYANSGLVDWSHAEYPFEEGEHTFEWRYKKDESDAKYSDAIWLDNIQIQ